MRCNGSVQLRDVCKGFGCFIAFDDELVHLVFDPLMICIYYT